MTKRASKWGSESEFAACVVSWLERTGWDVYQEVKYRGYGVADIVAVKGTTVWVIEAKLSFGLNVLSQAYRWRLCADHVSVAVPAMRDRNGHGFGSVVCAKFGIGVITASPRTRDAVQWSAPTATAAVNTVRLRSVLTPQHKTYALAGSNRGHWSPFKAFAKRLAELTAERQNWSLVEASTHPDLGKHYRSATGFRQCVPKLCDRGAIPGVAIYKERGAWVLTTA